MPERIQKINTLIKKHIDVFISKELTLASDVFITLSKVVTNKDLRHASIFISVFPESRQKYVEKTLHKEKYRLQKMLHKKLCMKPLPKISFFIDSTESKADTVEKILSSLKDER